MRGVVAGFAGRIPGDAAALLVLSEPAAEAVLRHGRAPPAGGARIAGDRRLLSRFFERYFAPASWLSLQAEATR